MELRPGLTIDDAFLAAFVDSHGIRRLALYGSALGAGFGPASDIDLLVEFRPVTFPVCCNSPRWSSSSKGRSADR